MRIALLSAMFVMLSLWEYCSYFYRLRCLPYTAGFLNFAVIQWVIIGLNLIRFYGWVHGVVALFIAMFFLQYVAHFTLGLLYNFAFGESPLWPLALFSLSVCVCAILTVLSFFLDVSVSLKLPMTTNAYLILIGSLLATLFVRRQVVYWKNITVLGFYCETPELYLRHARVYNVISWVLLFVLFVVGNWLRDFTPWLFFIVILAATLAGKLKATHQYRRILREMLESDALDTDERERISRQLSKSASELLDEKRRLNRMMSGKF